MNRSSVVPPWCPVARSLDRLGDPWSLLILRDAFYGLTRFDEFEQSLGVAPNILSARLKKLVANGLLERSRYSERPPRYEYLLTAAGRDARSISIALLAWGNRHLAPEGESIVIMNTETGKQADPVMIDGITGKPITDPVFRLAAGPAAPEAAHRRIETHGQRVASTVS